MSEYEWIPLKVVKDLRLKVCWLWPSGLAAGTDRPAQRAADDVDDLFHVSIRVAMRGSRLDGYRTQGGCKEVGGSDKANRNGRKNER